MTRNRNLFLAAAGLVLAGRVQAGVQAIWPIINLSQNNVTLSFDGENDCVYQNSGDYAHDDIDSYYAYYPRDPDDWAVAFRKFTRVSDLSTRSQAANGNHQLHPFTPGSTPDFLSFEMEMKNSGLHCFENTKTLDMNVKVGGNPVYTYRLNDAGLTHWQLYKIGPGVNQMIDLGAGGHFNWEPLTAIAALFEGKEPSYSSPQVASWGFTTIYDGLNVDDRSACILEKDILGGTDCLAAGVALVVLPSGVITALPLPDGGHNW
ncbi:hypothetical protein PV10_01461 [Exophiala mesophila]|uniref:Uncharacterized protein n=1 Tax=Exophiala mesophila TaxID=212818 RepID=A0A0D1YAS7_EXOME|nr:uncharacterized protein PV10_01461 [Exophiala mesophila]KIV97751.1 hypothetical protein PV10_01461 [Exophiala mesophila]